MQQEKNTTSALMREHVDQQALTGKTVDQYCREQDIKRSVFYYWKKKLSPASASNFISLSPSLPPGGEATITFTNGIVVCFGQLPTVDYLKQLIR